MREGPIERHLLKRCREHRMLCLKFTSPARAGVPDRQIITATGTVYVELKAPGATPRPAQVQMHQKMRSYGAEIHVVDSIRAVDQLIEDLAHRCGQAA